MIYGQGINFGINWPSDKFWYQHFHPFTKHTLGDWQNIQMTKMPRELKAAARLGCLVHFCGEKCKFGDFRSWERCISKIITHRIRKWHQVGLQHRLQRSREKYYVFPFLFGIFQAHNQANCKLKAELSSANIYLECVSPFYQVRTHTLDEQNPSSDSKRCFNVSLRLCSKLRVYRRVAGTTGPIWRDRWWRRTYWDIWIGCSNFLQHSCLTSCRESLQLRRSLCDSTIHSALRGATTCMGMAGQEIIVTFLRLERGSLFKYGSHCTVLANTNYC